MSSGCNKGPNRLRAARNKGCGARGIEQTRLPRRSPGKRVCLSQQGFALKARLQQSVHLDKIAARYELCGASIMNVVRYASLQALASGGSLATRETLQRWIRRKHAKDGKGA